MAVFSGLFDQYLPSTGYGDYTYTVPTVDTSYLTLYQEWLKRQQEAGVEVSQEQQQAALQAFMAGQSFPDLFETPSEPAPSTETPAIDTTATDTFDVSQIDLDSLDLDALEQSLADLNLDNIDIPTYEDINAALTGGSPTPSSLEGYVSAFNNQVNLLSSVGTLQNVDVDDRPYWYNSTVSGILGDNRLDPALLDDFKASAGIPDSFAVYDSGAGITDQSAQTVYGLLSSTDDPLQAISEYYGIDLSRAENPDAVYNNATKYGTDADRMAEFQSIIEPVLQKVIPYLQITQGLRYDDALEYAYKNDPMIAAIYNQYGVDLFRQTPDGSTYYFDPISGTESRTVEVKNSSFRDVGLVIAMAGFAPVIGTAVSGALSAMGIPTAITNAVAQAAATAFRTGGDVEAALTSAFTGIDPTATDLATYESYLPSIRTVVQDVYDAANQIDPTTVTPDTTINIDINQTDPITVDEDTGDVTVGLPEPTEPVTETTEGGGGGSTQTPSEAVTEPPTATATTTAADGGFWENATTDESVVARQIWEVYQGILNGTLEGNPEDILREYEVYTGSTEPPPESTEQTGTATGTIEETSGGDTTQDITLEDLLGNVGTIFGDTTADVPVEPSAPVKTPTSGTVKPTTDATVAPEKVQPVEPPKGVVVPKVPTTSVEKPTVTPTGTKEPTKPIEPPKGVVVPKVSTTEVPTKETPTVETTTPTLPDETGGLGTGTDTTDTGGTGGGEGTGDGTGDGTGTGDGSGDGDGTGDGKGTGLFGGIGAGSTVTAQPYMGSITFAPQMLTPIMPRQSIDYLAELIARLQQ